MPKKSLKKLSHQISLVKPDKKDSNRAAEKRKLHKEVYRRRKPIKRIIKRGEIKK